LLEDLHTYALVTFYHAIQQGCYCLGLGLEAKFSGLVQSLGLETSGVGLGLGLEALGLDL